MLARANRVLRADDFRTAVRRGRRVGAQHVVVYFYARKDAEPTRFGFIVSKGVGTAVMRNLVKRRLRSIGRASLSRLGAGTDVIIRALPASVDVPWTTLQDEIADAIDREQLRA